jgi:hypothetical protein
VLLPGDSTVVGIPLPFWTLGFLAYALVNFRHLQVVARRYLPFVLLPLLLVLVSFYGWITTGSHGWTAGAVHWFGCVGSGVSSLAGDSVESQRLPWKAYGLLC